MKKFWDKLWDVLPVVWGGLWIAIITFGSAALLIVVFRWLLNLLGVL